MISDKWILSHHNPKIGTLKTRATGLAVTFPQADQGALATEGARRHRRHLIRVGS